MDRVYLFLLIVTVINLVYYIKLYMNDKEAAIKKIKLLAIYIGLVFSIYKIVGEYFLIPLMPSLVLIPFIYSAYKTKKTEDTK